MRLSDPLLVCARVSFNLFYKKISVAEIARCFIWRKHVSLVNCRHDLTLQYLATRGCTCCWKDQFDLTISLISRWSDSTSTSVVQHLSRNIHFPRYLTHHSVRPNCIPTTMENNSLLCMGCNCDELCLGKIVRIVSMVMDWILVSMVMDWVMVMH